MLIVVVCGWKYCVGAFADFYLAGNVGTVEINLWGKICGGLRKLNAFENSNEHKSAWEKICRWKGK